jgi:hypothetical protein
MSEVAGLWEQIVPKVREGVTGIGVWTALKSCVPIAFDEGTLVLGVPSAELGGHLRMPQTSRIIEQLASAKHGSAVRLRVIDGTTEADWEVAKRRDVERRRMQEAEMTKMRADLQAKTSWDSVFENISRRYAAVPNRSLPQNRARFLEEAIEITVEARKALTGYDDQSERNFARCLERIAQYTEIPSALVALEVLRRAQEI